MFNLKFKRVRICSEAEQAAMSMEFHPKRTLIWGPNGAGKSAVIKSIFRAFDAEPAGKLPLWDYFAIIAVDFIIHGKSYTVVRRDDLRALYFGAELIGATTSSRDWNKIFCSTIGFDLMLLDQQEVFRSAAPANFFLPYFVNQDGSFGQAWQTFQSLKQFDKSIEHTLEYFAGIRPERYFELRANIQKEKSKHAEISAEISTLQRTRARLKRNTKSFPVKISAQEFQREIKELISRSTELAQKQDALRKHIIEDQELVTSIQEQIRLSHSALKEHDADFKFAGDLSSELHKFICPTCRAEHDDSFHTFLGLAEDARELISLKNSLEHDLEGIKLRLDRNRRKAADLRIQYSELEQLLNVKRGKFTFEDFVKGYSAATADEQFASEVLLAKNELDKVDLQLNALNIDLKIVTSNHDSKTPLDKFRENFARALTVLHVDTPPDIAKWKIATRPHNSGSRNARALIAYYLALWQTMANDDDVFAPIVIDSPNQGAQDQMNLTGMLGALASQAPKNAQVILTHETLPESFQADSVINIPKEKNLLNKEDFMGLSVQLFDLVERARTSLAGVQETVNEYDPSYESEFDSE